jgi:4-hydroxybenzoate polyprenyltransferase
LILSIAYFSPLIKLRQNAWFKLFTLAIVWTTTTALLPAVLNHIDILSTKNILHFFVRLSFMIGICIPFDIRDYDIDKADNISTLPHIFGENKTRLIAFGFMLLNIFFIVGEFLLEMFSTKIFIALMITAIINAIVVFMSSSKRSEYFYTALLDGTMILQGIALIGINYL